MASSRIEVSRAVTKRVILDLNEEEAEYLRRLTQNWLVQLGQVPAEVELEDHTEHRSAISAICRELNNCLEAK